MDREAKRHLGYSFFTQIARISQMGLFSSGDITDIGGVILLAHADFADFADGII